MCTLLAQAYGSVGKMALDDDCGHLISADSQKLPFFPVACWRMSLALQGRKP